MTTFGFIVKTCAVCKKKRRLVHLTSSNQMGSPDLDLRPSEMYRSTMGLWVERCPFCGYAARDISQETTIERSFLDTPEYLNCNNYPIVSDLAKMFYQAYLICRHDGKELKETYTLLLNAAWASDDEDDKAMAVEFRKAAVKELNQMKLLTQEQQILKADLMRRAGMFDEVISEYSDFAGDEKLLKDIVDFEIQKCLEKDDGCYKVSDVVDD